METTEIVIVEAKSRTVSEMEKTFDCTRQQVWAARNRKPEKQTELQREMEWTWRQMALGVDVSVIADQLRVLKLRNKTN